MLQHHLLQLLGRAEVERPARRRVGVLLQLHRLGADVAGIALPPNTDPSLFDLADIASLCESYQCDARDAPKLATLVERLQPEVVLHLAAQMKTSAFGQ